MLGPYAYDLDHQRRPFLLLERIPNISSSTFWYNVWQGKETILWKLCLKRNQSGWEYWIGSWTLPQDQLAWSSCVVGTTSSSLSQYEQSKLVHKSKYYYYASPVAEGRQTHSNSTEV